jgi:hypothetical protein
MSGGMRKMCIFNAWNAIKLTIKGIYGNAKGRLPVNAAK